MQKDNSVRLWDANGNQLSTLKHSIKLRSVSFSPTGKFLVSSLEDNTVRLWNLQGNLLATLRHSGRLRFWSYKNFIYFSPDEKVLATLLENNTIHLWNFQGKHTSELKLQEQPTEIRFSPNGQYFATVLKNNLVRLWDLRGNQLAELAPPTDVSSIYFSSDGQRFATLSNASFFVPSVLYLWDLQGNQLATIKSTSAWNRRWLFFGGQGIQFSGDEQFFTTSSEDGTAHLWNLKGEELAKFQHQGSIDGVEFSPDSKQIITKSLDSTVHLWDLKGSQLAALTLQGRNSSMLVSPDGEHLIFSQPSSEKKSIPLPLWSIRNNQRIAELSYEGQLNDQAFSPDGQHFATATGDGAVRLWNMAGQLVTTPWHRAPVNTVSFSTDGQRVATISSNGVAQLWNLRGNQLAEFKQQEQVSDIRFSPDHQHLATVSKDAALYLWSSNEKQPIILKQRAALSKDPVFSPDGQSFATASQENIARLWDLKGNQLAEFKHPSWVNSVSFSEDGQLIITTSRDQTARIWNRQGQQLAEMQHPGSVSPPILSSDRQHFITTSEEDNHKIVLKVSDTSGHTKTQSFTLATASTKGGRARLSNLTDWMTAGLAGGFLAVLGLSGSYILTRQILERQANRHNDLPTTDTAKSSDPPVASEFVQEMEDEIQVAQAVRQTTRRSDEVARNPFVSSSEYFPVTRRQMKQSWRYLRQFVREGPPTELDIEATVKEASQQGVLLKPALIPRRVNRTELLLLIDRDGSMTPFHTLARRLTETAVQGGRLAKAEVYYFHNCPDQYLYDDPNHQDARAMNGILTNLRADYTGVMIFSDAGAARGGFNPQRLELTAAFLAQLKQKVRYVVWLNPIPRSYWLHSTASEIAKLVPMFEFNRRNLHEAINVLRGKPAHHPSWF